MKKHISLHTSAAALCALLLAAFAPASHAQGQNMITNGGFEAGPKADLDSSWSSYAPQGWVSTIDKTYWTLRTSLSPAPLGSLAGTDMVYEGNYALMRTIFKNAPANYHYFFNSALNSIPESFKSLSTGQSVRFSVAVKANTTELNNLDIYGTLMFYDASGAKVGDTVRTSSAQASGSWTILSVDDLVIPHNATQLRVAGNITIINPTVSDGSYIAFDDFNVQVVQVPEASTLGVLTGAMLALGIGLRSRAKRKSA